MANKPRQKLMAAFGLSILFHLLLFLCFFLRFQPNFHENPKPPHYYQPAYVYTGAIPKYTMPSLPKTVAKPAPPKQVVPKPPQPMPAKNTDTVLKPKSMLAASLSWLAQNQAQPRIAAKAEEPILLIGDENTVADPLIKLIGKSLSAHFYYPRQEGLLGIKGKVIVGLTLHPEGYFSDIQILRSSQFENLDAAALYAINNAPKVVGANQFISNPKHFVIGFIFN